MSIDGAGLQTYCTHRLKQAENQPDSSTHTPVPSDDRMSWDHVHKATWLSLDRASRGIDSSLPEPVSLSVCSLSLSHTVLRLLFVLVVRLSVYPPPLSLLLTPGASVWR